MAKKKTYMEKMTEKYGTAKGASSASLSTASGSSGSKTSKKSGSSSNGGSYLERMNEKYGSAQTKQPIINVQKQRDTVNSVMKPSKVYSDRYKEYLESVMNGYNTARKYGSSGALTAPLNNTIPGATAYQKSYYDAVNNNFLPGSKINTANTAKKNSSKDNTAKVDKSKKLEDNSNESYNDRYSLLNKDNSGENSLTAKADKWAADNKELIDNAKEFTGILNANNPLDAAQKAHDALAKRYPNQVGKVDKYFDDLVEGTYKENEASRKANRELYASANPNWGKTATTAPLAKGGTFKKDIYEYLNDPDADKYIRDSFTRKGNEISSSARMFDSDEVERLGTMPEWIKQSEWYKNATEEDKKNRQQSKTGKFSLSKGFYSDRKFGATQSDIEVFNNMSEDEQKEYSYILGKYGEEKATAYLDTIKESVNERKANELYKQWLNEGADGLLGDATRYGKTLAGAVGSGLETFQRGATEKFLNAAAGSEDISTPRASEYLYQMQRANYDGAAGVGLDLAQNTAMMSPTLIAGAVASYFTGGAAAGEIASLATTMAPMAFGQAYEEAIADGADVRSAQKYAALEALNEAGGEYLLGGIENVAGGFTHQWAKDVLKNIAGVSDDMVSTTARALGHMLSTPEGRYLFSMGSEGFEEIVQGTVQNYLKNSVLGADESLNPFTEDNLYSAFIAMLSAGVSNAPSYVKANRYGKKVNVTAQDVRENAESISTKQSDYIDQATGDVDEQAYYDAMAEREHMLEQADYMEHGGQLTNAEAAELASANGGRIGMLNEAGRQSGLNAASDYEAVAERIANADADSDNKDVHEASNKAFDTAMAMAERAANNEQISNVEKGKAAIAARNIEAVSKMETTMRKAAEKREKAAARETDADKIADNKAGFEEYAAENAAGLYSEDSRSNMVSLYDGRVDADKYRAAYQRAYAAGFNNIDEKTAYNSMNMLYLNNEQKLQAYKDGMRDSNIYANRKLEYEQGEARVGGLIEGADKLDAKTGKFLDWVGKKTGVKIQIAEGLKGAAEINLDKGVMRINPYSKDFVGAAAHELTHLIKLYDRKSFDKLQKLTVESLMKSNKMSYEDLYRKYENEYVEKISSDYTVEDILEEITAEGATAYLNDADFAERVAKEDSRLAKRIADFFREIADTLKAIINEKGIRAVGRVMRENEARYRTAANIWYQALENAGEKYKAGYTAKQSDEGTKFMLNIDESDITEEYIDKNFEAVRTMEPVAELTGNEFDNGKSTMDDIIRYFDELGNRANNNDAGEIDFTKRFVKDVLGHKPNRRKFIMMAAVPKIIKDGKIVDYQPNYDGHGNGRVTIAAPVNVIGNTGFEGEYYGLVTTKVYPEHNRAYILNYTYTSKKKAASVFRHTGMQESISQEPGTEAPSSIRSIIEKLLEGNNESKENTKTKLQLFDEPVEYTKNLIAVRNVSSGNLASMLELEGMPSPSIAITKDSLGHTQFGDVTFIFGRDTIDPEADSRNMVWDADAWTPLYPGIEYEYDRDTLQNAYNVIQSAAGAIPEEYVQKARTAINHIEFGNSSLEDIKEKLYDNVNMKAVYLAANGKTVEMQTNSTEHSMTEPEAERSEFIVNQLGEDEVIKGRFKYPNLMQDVKEAYKSFMKERYAFDEQEVENVINNTDAKKLHDIYVAAKSFAKNGKEWTEVTEDKEATDAAIETVTDQKGYEKWIDSLVGNIIAEKGIRNNKDVFTSSGNRRSFRQLHDPVTAENIVKAMWTGKETGAVFLSGHTAKSIRGASTRKFGSIAEMHEQSGRLQNISDGDEFSKNQDVLLESADNKLKDIRAAIYERAGIGLTKSDPDTIVLYDNAYNDSVLNAATKAKNPNGIIREFAKNNISITKEEAKQLFETFDELRNLPTDYFEAKAKRVVGWDEVKLALVPDDIDVSLIDQMKAAGITDIRTYPAGDNAARAEMEGKADNLKFQLNIDDDPEWNYYANMIQDSNQETSDAADTLGELLSSVDYMPSNKAIERTAKRLKKYTATDTPLEDIIGNIKTVFSYIATNDNVNGKEISAILADYAGELITNSHKVEVDPTAQAEFRQFRNSIKGMTFHMPKGFEPELRSLGGIRQIRNESGLAIDITRDKGVSIDILYDELSDMYPGYFSKDITGPAEQLERIIETYKSLRPMPKVSYNTEEDYDAYRYYAGQEVFKAYIEEGINEASHKAEYRALQRTYNKKLKENEKTEKEMAALQAKATEMQAKYLSELEASRKKIDKQTHRERMEAARKSTKTRYWKDQIMKDAKELSNWLLKPTDKKHVPEALREPLANFLAQLDFTSLDLNANGEPTQRSIYWMKLRDTWSKIAQNGGMAEGETGTQYMVVDTDILEKMSQLTDKIRDIKKLEELEYIDVLKLSDVMKAMKHSIETANQMIALNRSVESVATGTMEDLKDVKDHKNAGKAEGFQDMMTNRMLDADTRFHTFGKNAEEVYRAVRLGMNKKIQKTKMSADWFTELMQKVTPAKKDWTGKLSVESTVRSWSKDKLNIKLSDGTDMQLTVAQAMNLYNLLKRDQARDHILRGGITLTSIESDDNIIDKALKAKKNPVNVHVTQSDCLNIINALTAEQKQFADGLANTLQKAAQWGNETSMELMGYKKFNDKFYWPIKSSRDYIATSMDDAAAGGVVGVAVKNAGPTKNVVRHANNPILIGDVVDVWSEHINFMANYNAFTIPLTDMVKWYNYVDYGDFREEPGSNRYKNSVKQELRRAYGTGADQYIMRFIEQINGSGNRKDSSPVKALISAFKGSAVGFNLSVVIQQPTAIARAGAVIEGKYLTAGLAATDTANWETIKKYSAIAQWKDWGFFDTDTGKSMKSLLTGQDTLLETLNDKQMWMAGKADEITWNRMWAAAELKVRAEHKELAKGSDAYYKKAAEIFDEIIDKTQVVDSVFTKSDLMRSENELNKLMTSFFAEPTKSYNMMYRAWFDWHVAKDAAAKNQMAKQFARAAFCWTLSNVLAAMAKSIVTTMRDRDEDRDKAFWERWLEHTWDELKGNMAPWNYIPWVKDVASIFEGYSVTRPDTEFASDLYYVAQRWQKYIDGESKYTLGNNILYSAKLLSAMTGVAWYSAQRDANGLIDTAIEVMGADELNYQKQKLTGKTLTGNVAYYLGKAMTAYKNDHKALGDQIISDMLKAGVPEDKIEEKKKEMLKENEDMQTLIDDTLSGNDEDIEETRAALVAQGYSEDMIDSRLKSGINSYMEDNELTYAGVNELLNGITDYTKAGFKEFDETYKEWAEMAKLKNGWDDKKCREQFRSQCTKYFKPKYQEGNAAERSRILNILSRAKSTDGTKIYAKDEDITKWGV